ncbi:organic solute transporter subunit alpha-like [Diadema antillarum]|uniref:organic solute transporter subunit alpha-like n=1 Tax=Diadema antillarum TaxID=105358 RepID=UPI003A8BF07B
MDNTTDSCSSHVGSIGEQIEAFRSIYWGIPLLSFLTVFAGLNLCMFIHSWVMIRRHVPYSARRIFLVRFFALFPIYSFTSIAGLYIPRAALITNWVSSLYMSTTLYAFVLLIVDYFGGIEKMEAYMTGREVSLRAPPFTCCCPCLPSVKFSMKLFHTFRGLVLQTAYIRPTIVFIGAVLWADGIYNPSSIAPDSAFIYLTAIGLLSSLLAVFGLSIIYNATAEPLQYFMVGAKFNAMKFTLILTNAQNLVMGIFVKTGVIPCVGPFNTASRGQVLYNMLVICEMFLLTVMLKFYYCWWMSKNEYGRDSLSKTVGTHPLSDPEKNNGAAGENQSQDVEKFRVTDAEKASENGAYVNEIAIDYEKNMKDEDTPL